MSISPNLRSTESAAGQTKSSSGEQLCIFFNQYNHNARVPAKRTISRHVICSSVYFRIRLRFIREIYNLSILSD